jgi:hypothetical protein
MQQLYEHLSNKSTIPFPSDSVRLSSRPFPFGSSLTADEQQREAMFSDLPRPNVTPAAASSSSSSSSSRQNEQMLRKRESVERRVPPADLFARSSLPTLLAEQQDDVDADQYRYEERSSFLIDRSEMPISFLG